jgi:hypothetical protein
MPGYRDKGIQYGTGRTVLDPKLVGYFASLLTGVTMPPAIEVV